MGLVRQRDNRIWKFYRKVKCKFYDIKYKQIKVAVIGVDGTGKTSLLKNIAEKYNNTSYTAYMGFKNVNNPSALKIMENKKLEWIPGIEGIKYYFGFYFEMRSRIKKAINSKKSLWYMIVIHGKVMIMQIQVIVSYLLISFLNY